MVWAGIVRYVTRPLLSFASVDIFENWGWACEQIAGIDVVTASGESLYCSETENTELFWCARGAGPGMRYTSVISVARCLQLLGFPAIVTRFYLKVRPRPEVMLKSIFIYPISEYKVVMDWITKATISKLLSKYSI